MRPVVPVRHLSLRRLNLFLTLKVKLNISLGKPLATRGQHSEVKVKLEGWGEVQQSKECRSLCPRFALGSKFCCRKLWLKIIKKDYFQVKFHVHTWGFTRHITAVLSVCVCVFSEEVALCVCLVYLLLAHEQCNTAYKGHSFNVKPNILRLLSIFGLIVFTKKKSSKKSRNNKLHYDNEWTDILKKQMKF